VRLYETNHLFSNVGQTGKKKKDLISKAVDMLSIACIFESRDNDYLGQWNVSRNVQGKLRVTATVKYVSNPGYIILQNLF
jgi:hypothetical protein